VAISSGRTTWLPLVAKRVLAKAHVKQENVSPSKNKKISFRLKKFNSINNSTGTQKQRNKHVQTIENFKRVVEVSDLSLKKNDSKIYGSRSIAQGQAMC